MARPGIVLTVLALSVGAFAGCVANQDDAAEPRPNPRRVGAVDPSVYMDRLSQVVFDEILKEHVEVPSFDGSLMDNWVFRPKTDEATQVPVFINFSPYWSNAAPAAETGGDAFSQYMIERFAPRGYAIVLSSLRGTGFSEGCFNIGGDPEKRDAVAVIDHFASQPWSNGNIAAGGKSYDGTTPQGAATLAPEGLKAIFPVSGISEMYKYSYKGGIPYRPTFQLTYFAGESTSQTWTEDPILIPEDAACPDVVGHTVEGGGAHGDYSAYWQERNYSKDAGKVQAALFFVHGFTDWNVKPDQILPWLNAIPADVPRKAWLHNWTARDGSSDGHVYPRRDDWNLTMLRFLDETLKGIDTGIFDEPAYQIQDSEGTWRWEEEWPPARAAPTKFYLGFKEGKGALDPAGPFRSGVRAFTDNGQAPSGSSTSGTNFLRYESPPLETDLNYAGVPRVHVQASSNLAVGKIVASLYDVAPDGTPRLINWGGINLRHRVATEDPQSVEPNEVYDLNWELFPQDDVVRAGHRLVLFLAGQSQTPQGGFGYQATPYQSTITVNENEEAYLELPLITTFDYEAPQPIQIPCFAC